MAFSASSTNCSSLQSLVLQSSSSVIIKPYPFLFFPSSPRSNPKKRFQTQSSSFTRRLLTTSNAASVDSSNGAAVASDLENPSSSYGRQYFPLAAVVGQVSSFSCSLIYLWNWNVRK